MKKTYLFFVSFFIFTLFISNFLSASEIDFKDFSKKKRPKKEQFAVGLPYEKNPYVDEKIWNALEPYFLPYDHPIRKKLDEIFKDRVTLNLESVKKAGFSSPKMRSFTKTVVTKHPKIKGYFFKFYTDDTPGVDDWFEHMQRITGAIRVKDAIEKNGYQSLFVVPKKYIYPLPSEPSPPKEMHRKNFILIAEDMNIIGKKKNRANYRKKMTTTQLDAMHKLIQTEGLDDSVLPDNLSFTKKGKLAFIDTGVHGRWPIRYNLTYRYLSHDKKQYWQNLFERR